MKKAVVMATLLMTFMLMTPIYAETTSEPTWFMMAGRVNSYAGELAHGWLWSCGKVGEWAMAHVFFAPGNWPWMDGNGHWNWTLKNFTYSFYTARLVNASIVELNYTKDTEFYDLYILGLWDVYNITFTYVFYNVTETHDGYEFTHPCWNVTRTMEQLVDDGTGELRITGNWTDFTIAITGIELIDGEVIFHWVRPMKPIPFGDMWGPDHKPDCKVDIYDLVHTAKAYGSTPGTSKYDFTIDFNFDTSPGIDICDLSTIAANLGET